MQDTLLNQVRKALNEKADPRAAINFQKFFKNKKSDQFLGIKVPIIRKIAKIYRGLSFKDIKDLMQSPIIDERALASYILVLRFNKSGFLEKEQLVDFYLENKDLIRDWSNVDNSCPYILGAYLLNKDKSILFTLAASNRIWDRRIAIVSTWWFIRNQHYATTLQIAEKLLEDKEDLIHKACGWMLRELGKKEMELLIAFLDKHAPFMPRTMLRYALEKFDDEKKKHYLKLKNKST